MRNPPKQPSLPRLTLFRSWNGLFGSQVSELGAQSDNIFSPGTEVPSVVRHFVAIVFQPYPHPRTGETKLTLETPHKLTLANKTSQLGKRQFSGQSLFVAKSLVIGFLCGTNEADSSVVPESCSGTHAHRVGRKRQRTGQALSGCQSCEL